MKVIDIPKTITVDLKDGEGNKVRSKEIAFKDIAIAAVDDYIPETSKTMKMVRQQNKLAGIIEAANSHFQLEDADYDLLKSAMDQKFTKIIGLIARQLLPYADAVDAAQDATSSHEGNEK